MDEIAKRCRLLRGALNFTQESMGRLIGATANAWGNYELGTRRIDIDKAIRLEVATGCPTEWIYQGNSARMPQNLREAIRAAEILAERDTAFIKPPKAK